MEKANLEGKSVIVDNYIEGSDYVLLAKGASLRDAAKRIARQEPDFFVRENKDSRVGDLLWGY